MTILLPGSDAAGATEPTVLLEVVDETVLEAAACGICLFFPKSLFQIDMVISFHWQMAGFPGLDFETWESLVE
jgi:hypothetical protein